MRAAFVPLLLERFIKDQVWPPPRKRWVPLVPWLGSPDDDLEFLPSIDAMLHMSDALYDCMGEEWMTASSSCCAAHRDDPGWIDADQSIMLAVNAVPGSDVAVVLDCRRRPEDPRVVASVYSSEHELLESERSALRARQRARRSAGKPSLLFHFWREVRPQLSAFLDDLGELN